MNSAIERLANQIAQATEGLSERELSWNPGRKWSIAEVLEHLSLTYTGTTIVFNRCLEANKASARTPSLKDRVGAFVVTRLGFLPSGREAPKPTRPKGKPPEAVLANIRNDLAAMDEAIAQCERKFGDDRKLVDHPIIGPLTAAEWRKFHCVHGRHHLRQIQRLRRFLPPDQAP